MPEQLGTHLIGDIYDAAMDRAPWGDVGARVARFLDGVTLNLFTANRQGQNVGLITTHGLSQEALQTYAAAFAQHDLWTEASFGKSLFNRPLIGSQIVADTTLERSIIYNEFLRPMGGNVFRFLGAAQRLRDGGFVIISTHRPRDAIDFDEEQQRRLALLLPHLGRAIELRQRLDPRDAPDASRLVIERLSQGVLQLGPTGTLLRANEAADRILRANDGLACARGVVRAASAAADKRLQQMIHAAARVNAGDVTRPGGHLRVDRPSGRPGYRCLVAPLGRDRTIVTAHHPAVILFIINPEDLPPIDPRVLQELYDLTPAEARIAAGLAMGEPLPRLAARLGISLNTARTLLARTTSKTQTDSQLALVRTILATLPGTIKV